MAEGGYENIFDKFGLDNKGYDEDGYNKYGYDEEGLNRDGYDKFGYDKNGYDKYGFNTYGHDKDGKLFGQVEGEENIPLLERTSTSNVRETQRPFKPRRRTSTRKEENIPLISRLKGSLTSNVGDGDEMEETSFGGFREKIPDSDFDNELREEVKKYFHNMDEAAVEVKIINDRLSVRLIGIGNEKWTPVKNKNGKLSIQFNKGLKKALGIRKEILKTIKEKIKNSQARKVELDKELKRTDLSSEVMNTTRNESIGNNKVLEELEQIYENEKIKEKEEIKEKEAIQNQTLLKERIKEIFKKYGFTITSVVTAVGVVIGVIVSKLTSGLSNMAKSVGNGLKDIGSKLAQILPGMIGAIASFIFKTAGEVLGFLAENAWILVVAVVIYLVESLKKKSKR